MHYAMVLIILRGFSLLGGSLSEVPLYLHQQWYKVKVDR